MYSYFAVWGSTFGSDGHLEMPHPGSGSGAGGTYLSHCSKPPPSSSSSSEDRSDRHLKSPLDLCCLSGVLHLIPRSPTPPTFLHSVPHDFPRQWILVLHRDISF